MDPAFYSIADTVVIFENSWSEFNPAPLNTVSGAILQKSTYVVHNFTGSGEMQANLINNITDLNIGGLLITTSDGYTDISSLWSEVCEELANKNNGGDLPDGDVYPVQSETKHHISSETTSRANLASC